MESTTPSPHFKVRRWNQNIGIPSSTHLNQKRLLLPPLHGKTPNNTKPHQFCSSTEVPISEVTNSCHNPRNLYSSHIWDMNNAFDEQMFYIRESSLKEYHIHKFKWTFLDKTQSLDQPDTFWWRRALYHTLCYWTKCVQKNSIILTHSNASQTSSYSSKSVSSPLNKLNLFSTSPSLTLYNLLSSSIKSAVTTPMNAVPELPSSSSISQPFFHSPSGRKGIQPLKYVHIF